MAIFNSYFAITGGSIYLSKVADDNAIPVANFAVRIVIPQDAQDVTG